MHADRLLRAAHPAFALDFVDILAQKSIGALLGIFGDAQAVALMTLPRVTAASTTAEIVFRALENLFHRAEGDLEILRELALRDRLLLIAFMSALPGC